MAYRITLGSYWLLIGIWSLAHDIHLRSVRVRRTGYMAQQLTERSSKGSTSDDASSRKIGGPMKRKRFSAMRFRKDDPTHNVIVAVNRWVRARGGKLLIIGGIEVQDWHEGMGKFKVAINCLGRKPSKETSIEPRVSVRGREVA